MLKPPSSQKLYMKKKITHFIIKGLVTEFVLFESL